MIHYGDIKQLSGYELPIVDVITGGSPCQDLSIAGCRDGLSGERSGLFMEQMRIVKEMREKDRRSGRTGKDIRPRYMVWENVKGAFSSNKGADFQTVLTEICKIAEPECPDVLMPKKNKWPNAGCLYDDMGRWSVAWRLHDAQYWGVPQRRKRIAVVADFGGLSAGEILFERQGLSGNSESGGEARERASTSLEKGINFADCERVVQPVVFENHSQDSRYRYMGDICETVSAKYGTGGNNQPLVVALSVGNGQLNQISMAEQLNTLDTMHDKQAVLVAAVDCRNGSENPKTNGTLQAKENGGTSINYNNVVRQGYLVRRVTPLECERLQGMPDNWTNIGEWIDEKGKKHRDADSPRYKALGNGIALPFWEWLMGRISDQYDHPATLGSLFDGISSFPFAWSKFNGKENCVWCSEIEQFPIAVSKKHFPDT